MSVLRRAADDGDSLLSTVEVLTRLGRLDLARPCVVPLDWFPGNAEFLDPVINQIEVEVPTAEAAVMQQLAALQLASHADTELRLGRILLKRAEKELPSVGAKWRTLLIEAIRKTGARGRPRQPPARRRARGAGRGTGADHDPPPRRPRRARRHRKDLRARSPRPLQGDRERKGSSSWHPPVRREYASSGRRITRRARSPSSCTASAGTTALASASCSPARRPTAKKRRS